MRGKSLGSRTRSNDPFEIARSVLSIGDFAPVAVEFALRRMPARRVRIRDHTVNAVGCQEAIGDTLAKAALVNWITEVVHVNNM